ncbi:MAG TPA: hypothetical protein VL171_18645 [Verrucomicrobiae bacterium]|nr:hypothetical protein [Verrucomicrobiae bacterium]
MSFLSLNRSLMNQGGEIRQFRLPRMNPFPKLDARVIQRSSHGTQDATTRPAARGTVIIEGGYGYLPEMTTDVIDTATSYSVENVKRGRRKVAGWSRLGFGHLIGRTLESRRAARL